LTLKLINSSFLHEIHTIRVRVELVYLCICKIKNSRLVYIWTKQCWNYGARDWKTWGDSFDWDRCFKRSSSFYTIVL